MKNKLLIVLGTATAAVGSLLGLTASAAFTSSTLEANIGTLGDTINSYFQVMISAWWPLLLGIIILVGIIYFARHAIGRMFSK